MYEVVCSSGESIHFRLLRRVNARSVRLSVLPGGEVRVSAPKLLSMLFIRRFVRTKEAWVRDHIAAMKQVPRRRTKKEARDFYLAHKESARAFVIERIAYYNRHYKFTFQRISVRDQRTRWGSCSRKGNLNFNYRIFFLPQVLADYVIVHELCHLKEFNHGAKFWDLVAKQIPDHLALRKALHAHKHPFNEKTSPV